MEKLEKRNSPIIGKIMRLGANRDQAAEIFNEIYSLGFSDCEMASTTHACFRSSGVVLTD